MKVCDTCGRRHSRHRAHIFSKDNRLFFVLPESLREASAELVRGFQGNQEVLFFFEKELPGRSDK